LLIYSTPALAAADALWLEPKWIRVRRFQLTTSKPIRRLLHFTDVHYKGDRAYLQSVVKTINALSPDFVCFTGDIVEETRFLDEALTLFKGIKAPIYGVPGNHEYWSGVDFKMIASTFAATGGKWLVDDNTHTASGELNIIGVTCQSQSQPPLPIDPSAKNILLMHYPAWVNKLGDQKLDLILAGHSHGGQVRIPFWGPVTVPFGVGQYDFGLFKTVSGPLYVNPGIGWFLFPVRFLCRPQITVIEI